MTRLQFFFLSAVIAWCADDGRAQTSISASQVVCPASAVPVVAVAMPATVGGAKLKLVCIPLDPASFRIDTSVTPAVIRAIGSQFVEGEIPGGAIDGNNAVYSLATAPSPATSLRLYRNGVRLQAGVDYTLTGAAVTFLAAAILQSGDSILADYRH